jgi:hypothetical protein
MWQNWLHWTVALLLAVVVGFLLGWTTRPSAVLAEQPGLIATGRYTVIPIAGSTGGSGGGAAVVLDTTTGESWRVSVYYKEDMKTMLWGALGPALKPTVPDKQPPN